MQQPLVSVWMITYNHEKYIRQSLENVIAQKTNFPFEVIIGEDCSTDGTRAILREFEEMYPDIIKPVYHDSNVGAMQNAYEYCYPRLSGKYVACLEGDDYWIDENKLQKQVDFLEANPGYAICFHQVYELYDEKEFMATELFSSVAGSTVDFSIDDLATYGNFIHSASVVFKNFLIPEFPSWLKTSPIGDYVLHMLNAKKGKIAFLPNPMSVYRKHDQGAWAMKGVKYQLATWLTVLENLVTEFAGNKEVCEKLKGQFARNAINLADIYQKEGNNKESATYLRKAFAFSELFMNDWVNEVRNDYSRIQSEFTAILNSKEYRTGRYVQNPAGLIWKLLSIVKRKIIPRDIVEKRVYD